MEPHAAQRGVAAPRPPSCGGCSSLAGCDKRASAASALAQCNTDAASADSPPVRIVRLRRPPSTVTSRPGRGTPGSSTRQPVARRGPRRRPPGRPCVRTSTDGPAPGDHRRVAVAPAGRRRAPSTRRSDVAPRLLVQPLAGARRAGARDGWSGPARGGRPGPSCAAASACRTCGGSTDRAFAVDSCAAGTSTTGTHVGVRARAAACVVPRRRRVGPGEGQPAVDATPRSCRGGPRGAPRGRWRSARSASSPAPPRETS